MSKTNTKPRKGFTIVELLIVIVVIAILAAITVVSYNSVVGAAVESTMKSDLHGAASVLEIDRRNAGTYPSSAAAANGGKGLQSSGDNVLSYTQNTGGFCLSVTNNRTAKKFSQVNGGQIQDGGCPIVTETIATGITHSCAAANGQAYCWGAGNNGRLGNGDTAQQNNPVAVTASGVLAGKTVTAIAASNGYTCVVASGQAYCWGYGGNGQLGTGNTTEQLNPVAVDTSGVLAGKTVTAIATGANFTCAVASGQAYCWGGGTSGQLGDGTSTNRLIPVAVAAGGVLAGKTVTAITAGNAYACAVANGQAYCWGDGASGQLGNGGTSVQPSPVAVTAGGALAGKTVTAIASGIYHTCAAASGQAYCWGSAAGNGRLGDGSATTQLNPIAVNTGGVLGGKTVTAISVSGGHSCAMASGQAYCWGDDGNGQLGDGATAHQYVPVATNTSGALAGKTVTTISAGSTYTCVVASGQAYCWGNGANGRLGNGTTTQQTSPFIVSPLPQI